MFAFLAVMATALLIVDSSPVMPPFVAHSYARLSGRDEPQASSEDNQVAFTTCKADNYEIHGTGEKLTIELEFMSYLDSDNPRSSIVAGDPKEVLTRTLARALRHASTQLPDSSHVASTYVYHFQTLASNFNYLTFNVTNDFFGPSLFCAGTNVNFNHEHERHAPKGGCLASKELIISPSHPLLQV
ncbi:hypothetical protein KEM48_009943 [Puccinia striiformis f. sp. tritici PST-130]|nr:hypothetical protein KEM48_009943 [Puccinia striiformis f. sp. tritici PST-130]